MSDKPGGEEWRNRLGDERTDAQVDADRSTDAVFRSIEGTIQDQLDREDWRERMQDDSFIARVVDQARAGVEIQHETGQTDPDSYVKPKTVVEAIFRVAKDDHGFDPKDPANRELSLSIIQKVYEKFRGSDVTVEEMEKYWSDFFPGTSGRQ